ncbi:F-box protein [Trifolium medium]|uniref:F-box protein n=1 Tax=Trifolium medium TaxID=97028 RepID=A0A392M648_9FABA|nr:F-box protein [Trifolium medium]
MAAKSDWSELPKDLLNLISQQINNEVDLIRFRSICSNWRSSSIPIHHSNILPFKFPLLEFPFNIDSINNNTSFCNFSKCSYFLIKPPPQQQQKTLFRRPWLIRVIQNSSGKTKLSQFPLPRFDLPSPFQFSLDLNRFSVLHLGTGFIIDFEKGLIIDFEKGPLPNNYLFPKKVVAVTPRILAILLYNNHLVLLRSGNERWTDLLLSIEDICFFKGRIYAVEVSSKTVTIGPEDLSIRLVANHVLGGGGNIKFLVESEGEMLLVDIKESFCFDSYLEGAFDDAFKDALTIDVFRLDEKEKEWVELTSLGDRILFLGDRCSFSVSASDLSAAKGNCVVFMDDVFEDYMLCEKGMCVFHFDQGQLSPLSDYPDYLNLFRPPPKWIVKSCTPKTKKSMLSCIERFLM